MDKGNLENKSLADLRYIAKMMNIQSPTKYKKDELIALIVNSSAVENEVSAVEKKVGDAAEEPAKPYERLLKQITAKHNEEVKSNFQSGLLDFVPDEITPEEMLMQIIAGYAVRNCPEVLETEQGS